MKIKQRLVDSWMYPELYAGVIEWSRQNGNAWLDPQGGVSWIDGETYLSTIWIYNEQDLVAFKLKFGSICAYHEIVEYD